MPRKKEFVPEVALEAAMRLFWQKGYAATSVQELTDVMGINRFSLYDTFGDKHTLYLAAIDLYCTEVTSALLVTLDADDGVVAIRSYFRQLVRALATEIGRDGCLVQNATLELAVRDRAVSEKTKAINRLVEHKFEAAIRRAQKHGAIDKKLNAGVGAISLFALAQGLIVLAKDGRDADAMGRILGFVQEELDRWRSFDCPPGTGGKGA